MPHHDWSLPTSQAALVIKIADLNNSANRPTQVSFKRASAVSDGEHVGGRRAM